MREIPSIDAGHFEVDPLTGDLYTHLSLFNISAFDADIEDDYPVEFKAYTRWSSHEFYKTLTRTEDGKVVYAVYRSATTSVKVHIVHG